MEHVNTILKAIGVFGAMGLTVATSGCTRPSEQQSVPAATGHQTTANVRADGTCPRGADRYKIDETVHNCANVMISNDQCNLNVEAACINGVEINFVGSVGSGSKSNGDLSYRLQSFGFNNVTKTQAAVHASDFSNPSKMYNTFPVYINRIEEKKGGAGGITRESRLCTQIKGYQPEIIPNFNGIDVKEIQSLPKNQDYTVESVPAIIKGGTIIRWTA